MRRVFPKLALEALALVLMAASATIEMVTGSLTLTIPLDTALSLLFRVLGRERHSRTPPACAERAVWTASLLTLR